MSRYMLTIEENPNSPTVSQVFYHPIAGDRVAEVIKVVMEPRKGDSPEDLLLAGGFITQKMFNKIVRARNGTELHAKLTLRRGEPLAHDGEG